MKAHWQYLKYVLRHKWYVFRGCLALGVPIHQAIIHDWVKFLPVEWFPYVRQFYGEKPTEDDERRTLMLGISIRTRAQIKADFDNAWNHHQKTQPHHWQYWLLITDSDEPRLRPLAMPHRFILEMVADWYGAGMAINGAADVGRWYEGSKSKIILHPQTRELVEQTLEEAKWPTK